MPRSASLFKKRKFRGNRFTNNVCSSDSASAPVDAGESSDVCTAEMCEGDTPTSASKKKLSNCASEITDEASNEQYVLVDFPVFTEFMKKCLCCNLCGGSFDMNITKSIGLSCKIAIVCASCENETCFWSSKTCSSNLFESNIRLMYAMRAIGKGHTAAQTFCAIMNLPPPPAKIDNYTEVIGDAVQSVADLSMKAAASEAKYINEGNPDIPVAFDGTWQKRGHTSKNAVATVTSVDSGKVLDYEVLTKHCYHCASGKKEAAHICSKNYEGTSGGMEAAAAVKMFSRSEKERGVFYTKFLGDGDSKAYKSVTESMPYVNKTITKLECVGHVQKRMGTRLRKLKQNLKDKILSDGKTIRGRLSDKIINELQQYYGMAIRNNANNLQEMRQAVWATYLHRSSTDDNPQHFACPDGPQSWCNYRKSQATGDPYHHKNSIPLAVMEVIKPIYRDLGHPDLLRKCLHGCTQNQNESFNNLIWTRVPKNVFVGIKTLKWGVSDAVISFNDGHMGRLKVMARLGIAPGINTIRGLQLLDNVRVRKAQYAAEFNTKKARAARRRKLLGEEEELEDDPDYSAGHF